jgi:hypothetical protein
MMHRIKILAGKSSSSIIPTTIGSESTRRISPSEWETRGQEFDTGTGWFIDRHNMHLERESDLGVDQFNL